MALRYRGKLEKPIPTEKKIGKTGKIPLIMN
jgi:hypothetical protein